MFLHCPPHLEEPGQIQDLGLVPLLDVARPPQVHELQQGLQVSLEHALEDDGGLGVEGVVLQDVAEVLGAGGQDEAVGGDAVVLGGQEDVPPLAVLVQAGQVPLHILLVDVGGQVGQLPLAPALLVGNLEKRLPLTI